MATATETERSSRTSNPWADVPGVAGPWRLTVNRYLELSAAGFFRREDRVMLWEGQIVEKMTKHRPHVVVTRRLYDVLTPLVAAVAYVETEAPVRLRHRDDTLPEPDLKVVRGRDTDYATEPTSAATPLVIEVAESSLTADRNEVLKKFAIESVPEYWIANIPARRIEVYTEPSGPSPTPGYATVTNFGRGSSVPVNIDGQVLGEIAVSAIFGDNDPWLK